MTQLAQYGNGVASASFTEYLLTVPTQLVTLVTPAYGPGAVVGPLRGNPDRSFLSPAPPLSYLEAVSSGPSTLLPPKGYIHMSASRNLIEVTYVNPQQTDNPLTVGDAGPEVTGVNRVAPVARPCESDSPTYKLIAERAWLMVKDQNLFDVGAALTERILARLEQAEDKEHRRDYQTDIRIAWCIVLHCANEHPIPVVQSWYDILGTHPSKVWGKVCHDRECILGLRKKPAPAKQKAMEATA